MGCCNNEEENVGQFETVVETSTDKKERKFGVLSEPRLSPDSLKFVFITGVVFGTGSSNICTKDVKVAT